MGRKISEFVARLPPSLGQLRNSTRPLRAILGSSTILSSNRKRTLTIRTASSQMPIPTGSLNIQSSHTSRRRPKNLITNRKSIKRKDPCRLLRLRDDARPAVAPRFSPAKGSTERPSTMKRKIITITTGISTRLAHSKRHHRRDRTTRSLITDSDLIGRHPLTSGPKTPRLSPRASTPSR
jgi:hypothetical protein